VSHEEKKKYGGLRCQVIIVVVLDKWRTVLSLAMKTVLLPAHFTSLPGFLVSRFE
jgi:hypothetical protein